MSARLALVGRDESLTVEFAPPADDQAAAAAKEHGKGIALAQRGRLREALPRFKRAVQLWPLNADYLAALGHAYLELHQLQEAESTFLTCLRLAPEDPDVLTMLGNVYFAQGKLELAGQLYEFAWRRPVA